MIDISNPSAPIEVAVSDTILAYDVAITEMYAYVASGENGLRIFDIADPTMPIVKGIYDSPGSVNSVAVAGTLAVVADWDDGLRIVDINDAEAPHEIGYWDEVPGRAIGVSVTGNNAIVSYGADGFYVIDFSSPSIPFVVGYYDTPGTTQSVECAGGFAYVADDTYFGIYDVSTVLNTSPSFNSPPSSFALAAYPNPFNAVTQIRFDLPQTSPVELTIYDLNGRLVEHLASRLFDSGSHSIRYDATHCASGMYLVQLTSGEFSATQKLILLK